MFVLRFVIPLLLLLLAAPDLEAQRGGRSSGKRTRSSQRDKADMGEFSQRLWFGASGVLGLSGTQDINFAAIGLIPQVGYKFNEWLSAGPRIGLTYTTIKGTTVDNRRERSNTWSYSAGVFARARVLNFYAQTEVLTLSDEQTELVTAGNFGPILLNVDRSTGRVATFRESDTQWLLGVGYNAGVGAGISSDFGVFYNIFDSVESTQSPVSFRLSLTYNY